MNKEKRRSFVQTPAIVMWEVTRACDLICSPCRGGAITKIDPNELTLLETKKLLADIKKNFSNPLLVLVGGDPFKRPDIYEIIQIAHNEGITTSLNVSPTGLATTKAIEECKNKGISRIAINLDGSKPKIHDAFRRLNGSFRYSMNIINHIEKTGLPVQVNTLITKFNDSDFHNILRLVKYLNVVDWLIFFLIPVGRIEKTDCIESYKIEKVFEKIYNLKEMVKFNLRVIDAPNYRRYSIQRILTKKHANFRNFDNKKKLSLIKEEIKSYPVGISDGNGYIFITHNGDVYPNRYMPISCGNVKKQSITTIYRNSAVLKKLRDYKKLKGKCGTCEFKIICGGSRARAYAYTNDYLEQDPACLYTPIN